MNRRGFLRRPSVSATAGFLAGFYLPERSKLLAQTIGTLAPQPKLNAWIHIAPDDTVTFMIHKVEMGQGTLTSLSQLLADELDCDWGKFRNRISSLWTRRWLSGRSRKPEHPHIMDASAQGWRGCHASMLVDAAAQSWNVDKSQCRTQHGFCPQHREQRSTQLRKTGRRRRGKSPVPKNPALKDPKEFKLIGKLRSIPRLRHLQQGDRPHHVRHRFACRPNTWRLHVLRWRRRCPVFWRARSPASMPRKAVAFPGVKQVVAISTGVAVVAENTWSGHAGCESSSISNGTRAPTPIRTAPRSAKLFANKAQNPGAEVLRTGDAPKRPGHRLEENRSGCTKCRFLAHATMEPI